MRLKKGSKVEVLDLTVSPSGSWRPAEIISGNGRTYQVRYEYSQEMGVVEERVQRKAIRPCPPPVQSPRDWVPGDIIEVFDGSSWRLAEVSKLAGGSSFFVRLLGTSKLFRTHISDLRPRLSWQGTKWVTILKECNNVVVKGKPKKGYSCNQLPASVDSRQLHGNDLCSTNGAHHFENDCLVLSRNKKRPRLCLAPPDDCRGANMKIRTIEKEGGCKPMVVAPSSQLLAKVDDAVSSPPQIYGGKYMSLNNNRSGFLGTNLDWAKPNEDMYFFLGSLDTSDSESVGSCSINTSPSRLHNCQTSRLSHDLNSQDDDGQPLCGSGRVPSLSAEEDLAAEVHRQELHAYRCTITALYASGPLSWEKEALLTNLRLMLHISNDEHLSEGQSWRLVKLLPKVQDGAVCHLCSSVDNMQQFHLIVAIISVMVFLLFFYSSNFFYSRLCACVLYTLYKKQSQAYSVSYSVANYVHIYGGIRDVLE